MLGTVASGLAGLLAGWFAFTVADIEAQQAAALPAPAAAAAARPAEQPWPLRAPHVAGLPRECVLFR